jgi:hypothetical protein
VKIGALRTDGKTEKHVRTYKKNKIKGGLKKKYAKKFIYISKPCSNSTRQITLKVG